jgi:Fe-S-cluster-containing dehydrogenase component
VESPHGAIEVPAYVSDTLTNGAVAIPTGLGHTAYGRFARDLGQSPYALLSGEPVAASGGRRWLGVRVRLQKTGRREKLASPAGVTEVDHQREIFETVGLAEAVAAERGGKAPAHANLPSMYPDLKYPQNRWGMTIDLDACTGCQACVVACQAENNVPWVGKGDIDYGRSVQWLRVERWWDRGHGAAPAKGHAGGSFELVGAAHAADAPPTGRPSARFLPMLCQHCEVAPCEPVCPVFAAYHTADGLNAQVYNRCVGTRYCGNNCPYMVRRFNWYRYEWPAPMNLQLNPDVAVRDRGIMEKCTMCVQRIIAGRDRARDENRLPWDGEIQTACQQTCPTQAITFGDLKDGRSRVSRLSASPRGYHVLGDLGTKPAVTYLRKILRETHA